MMKKYSNFVIGVFFSTMDGVAHEAYFVQRNDVIRVLGLSNIQKYTIILRMLAYNIATNVIDEYYRLGKITTTRAMKQFMVTIKICFLSTYLKQIIHNDNDKKMKVNANKRFLGMLGALTISIGFEKIVL
jgi:hypothetical protein